MRELCRRKDVKKHNNIISCGLKIIDCKEEYTSMLEFYENVLQELSKDYKLILLSDSVYVEIVDGNHVRVTNNETDEEPNFVQISFWRLSSVHYQS